ncbi:MAG: hypothetical protein FWG31_09725 [Oscillospiraceae bacterium]|nr:hypothetical protein [Oscillospiraceae bacterium]
MIGITAYCKLVETYGGGPPIYIPRLAEVEREQRDESIHKEFTGRNYKELAKKYRLTEMSIKRILKKERQKEAVN